MAQISPQAEIDPSGINPFGPLDGAAHAMTLLKHTLGPGRAQQPLSPALFRLTAWHPPHSATRALARMGHPVRLTILPNHDHWVYDIGPERVADTWDRLDHLP